MEFQPNVTMKKFGHIKTGHGNVAAGTSWLTKRGNSIGANMKHQRATDIAVDLRDKLKPFCEQIEIAGSIRRHRENVKDIELVCIPKMSSPGRRMASWCGRVAGLGHIIKGKDLNVGRYFKVDIVHELGSIKLDLFVARPENFGMAYLVRTGSADYSRYIFGEFNKRGYESKDGRHVHKVTGEIKEFKTEIEIFKFLNIKYVFPEHREIKN